MMKMNKVSEGMKKHINHMDGVFFIPSVQEASVVLLAEYITSDNYVFDKEEYKLGYVECMGVSYTIFLEHHRNLYTMRAYASEAPSMHVGVVTLFRSDVNKLVEEYKQRNNLNIEAVYRPCFLNTYGVMCDPRVQQSIQEYLSDKMLYSRQDSWYRFDMAMKIQDQRGYIDVGNSIDEVVDAHIYGVEYFAPKGYLCIAVYTTAFDDEMETYNQTETIIGRALYPLPTEEN